MLHRGGADDRTAILQNQASRPSEKEGGSSGHIVGSVRRIAIHPAGASAVFAHFALHASPIRGSYHSHPPPRSDTAFHSRRRADAPSSSGIFAGRGRIRTAPPRHVLRRFRRQMAHAELERRRNEGKNDRSDLSRTEINRPKILQTLKNVLSLRRKTNGKRRKMDNHVPFLLFPKGCKSQHFDSQHVVCMA